MPVPLGVGVMTQEPGNTKGKGLWMCAANNSWVLMDRMGPSGYPVGGACVADVGGRQIGRESRALENATSA